MGKKTKTILHPITNFTVSYVAGTDTVDLSLIGTQAFASGGQLTVVKSGVMGASDAALAGSTVFAISKKGTTISPTKIDSSDLAFQNSPISRRLA